MFYENIEAERKRRGLTKARFAAAVGIHPRTYAAYQRRGKIPARILVAIARLFDCSIDYLLGRKSA